MKNNGPRWRLISHSAGLLIVLTVLVLIVFDRHVNLLLSQELLAIAAALLGLPSFWRRGNGTS